MAPHHRNGPRPLWLLLLAWLLAAPPSFAQESARPWLGVSIGPGPVGVLVKDVIPGTPAETYGLKPGDQITAIASIPVHAPDEMIAVVQAQGVGATVAVAFVRDGTPVTRDMKLVARPDELDLLKESLVGRPAPALDLQVLRGTEPGNLAQLAGRVVLVEFWATWCGPCRSTHARLSELAKTDPRIAVLAVSSEEEAVIRAYVEATKPAFTVLRDTKRETQRTWLVPALPTLVVVDESGRVAFATLGAGPNVEEAIAVARKLAGS